MSLLRILPVFLALADSVKLPPSFLKCNRHQPDLQDCLLKAAQHGAQQLTKSFDEVNIPSLDPLEIPGATIGAGRGVVSVVQIFKNCKIFGLHTIKLDRFVMDFDNKTVDVAGSFPEIRIDSDYQLDGNVLLLPIKGEGPSRVILRHLKVTAFCTFEERKKKSKSYFKFLTSDVTLDPKGVNFKFENLFGGDERLGERINRVLNDNWKDVFDDVKHGYVEVVNKILLRLLNNFFGKVSIEEALD